MLFPHEVGFGAKQWEHTGFAGSLSDILYALCAYPERRGGGDFENDNEENTGMFSGIQNGVFKGRWHGDRVAVVGDYAEFGDLPDVWDAAFVEITDANGKAARVFNSARTAGDIGWANAEPFFHNIADEVRPFIAKLWERAEADLEALRNKRPVSIA
jgi:hypothetical protein